MAIAPTDFTQRLSGGAANNSVSASIGGAKSSNAAPAGRFGTISGAEAAAGVVKYRCTYVQNGHGTLTAIGATVAVQSDTPDAGTIVAVGVGAAAVNAPETAIANETTAPAGVAFATSATLGDIPAGQYRAVWERLTVSAGAAAVTGDAYNLRLTCDTAA
jgi:hypothetical protein